MATNLILDDDRLPVDVERGASGGPRFQTIIQSLRSGKEVRIPVWSKSRGEWDIAYGLRDLEDGSNPLLTAIESIVTLFYGAQGRTAAFLFKDWSDYRIGDPDDPGNDHSTIGSGDGAATVFQIVKRYELPSGASHDRTIHRIVAGTLAVYLDDLLQAAPADYSADLKTGVITFTAAPGAGQAVAVACEFDLLVRFDDDHLSISTETFEAAAVEPIVVVEVKE